MKRINTKIRFLAVSLLAAFLFFQSAPSSADSKNPLVWQTIEKGTLVAIRAYNKADDTYHVVVVEESAVGPLMSASEEVAKAVNYPDEARLKRNPALLVGNQYQLNTALAALSEKGLALRREAVQKKKEH